MRDKQKCQGLLGLLLGHHFESQYDSKEALPAVTKVTFFDASVLEVMKNKKKVYRGSVCRRCGLKLEA